MKIRAGITAVGHYVPERILTNFDLEKMVDTNDEWIRSRTGIIERRICAADQATSDLAVEAARSVIQQSGLDVQTIDAIIVATVTPDHFFPSTGNIVQEKLGAHKAFSYDLAAACSGFLYALHMGMILIESGRHKKVIVIGADKMSSIVNYKDRNTCVLFGDAAGAVLLEPIDEADGGILDSMLFADGSGAEYLYMKAGGSKHPPTMETLANDWHFVYQDGKSVFKFAVQKMADVAEEILTRNGFSGKDLKMFIPHQANLRIIDAAVRRLKIDYDQVMINISRYGNTTAATIPLALSEAYQMKKLEKGDLVVFAAFGGGFTWGSTLLRWSLP